MFGQHVLTRSLRLNVGEQAPPYSKVVTDSVTNRIYVGGAFSGTLSVGQYTIESDALLDAFICAFDEQLNPLWLKRFGGNGTDIVTCMTVVPGKGLVAGLLCGANTVGFPTYLIGDVLYTGRGSADAVIALLDSEGDVDWSRNDGDVNPEQPLSIAIINDGFAVVGEFVGTSRFDTVVVKAPRESAGYLQRLDKEGNQLWIRTSTNVEGFDVLSNSTFSHVLVNSDNDFQILASVLGTVVFGTDTLRVGENTRVGLMTVNKFGMLPKALVTEACSWLTSVWDVTPQLMFSGFESTEEAACETDKKLLVRYFASPVEKPIDIAGIFEKQGRNSLQTLDVSFYGNNIVVGGSFNGQLDVFLNASTPDVASQTPGSFTDGFVITGTIASAGMRAIQLGADKVGAVQSVALSNNGFVALAGGEGRWNILDNASEITQNEVVILQYTESATSVNEAEDNDADNQTWYTYSIDGRLVSPLPLRREQISDLPTGMYVLRNGAGVSLCYVVGAHNIAISRTASQAR
ncbi:MAG: hypothetical protein HYX66_08115 [Ignavibacteria bacterium]|nr:hypothetical protein [Ignavibacteria bacterium]